VAGLSGILIDRSRLIPPLDDAAHGAIAYLDRHVVDGGILWKGEGIDGFDFLCQRILECLRNLNPCDETADRSANLGMLQRAVAAQRAIFAKDLQRAGSFAGCGSDGCFSKKEVQCEKGEK